MNVRGIAAQARRRIGEPTYASVPRQYAYDAVWREQQFLITHARRSQHAWYTKTLQMHIDGSTPEYVIQADDFGGIYSATYDPIHYPNERRGEIDTFDILNREDYDFGEGSTSAITEGALRGISHYFDGDDNLEKLVVVPPRRAAFVVVEYLPSHVMDQSPDGRPPLIQAFHSTLLVAGVALELLQHAKWDGYDEAGNELKRDGYTNPNNANNLSAQYERYFAQYDRYIFSPYKKGRTVNARPFGWARRGY